MKRIEVLSLNTILNPIDIKNLSNDALLKVIKLKSLYKNKIKEHFPDRLFISFPAGEENKRLGTIESLFEKIAKFILQ